MPEETETTGQLPVVNRLENRKDRSTFLAIGSVIAIVLAVVGIYLWQHRQITNLNASISKERVTVASLRSQLTTLDNLNNGVTTASSQASSIVSLVNGKVAFTMPVGWVLASASRFYQQCYNGAFDSKVTCLDSETIVPKALDVDTATSTYG